MKKILFLVDNDRTIRMFYQEKLSLLGLEVMTSDDCEGLYERIDSQKPDIIFTDSKRWEELSVFPAFQYSMEPVDCGYVIGRAVDGDMLDVRVNVGNGDDNDSLELILLKGDKRTRSGDLATEIRDRSPRGNLPPPMEIPHQRWALALHH